MPSPTPDELQKARRASGRLGGRPRKPTRDEAREAALAALLPKALRVLGTHLGDGEIVNPDAWRAALRVFEHAFGRPATEETAAPPSSGLDDMTDVERDELRRQLIDNFPHLRNPS